VHVETLERHAVLAEKGEGRGGKGREGREGR
jgi:hypothetical protein